jgi:hypothetical protein
MPATDDGIKRLTLKKQPDSQMRVLPTIINLLNLSYLLCTISCTTKLADKARKTTSAAIGVTFKVTNLDSIVLIGGTSPFFEGVEFFRNQKSILRYTTDDLQIYSTDDNGNDSNWFTEHKDKNGSLYIIRVFNGPAPDRFLIVRSTSSDIRTLGITEPNSAEIFGDIDFDGIFEIGGFSQYCQGGDKNCNPSNYYSIIELEQGFNVDRKLTDFFRQTLQNK